MPETTVALPPSAESNPAAAQKKRKKKPKKKQPKEKIQTDFTLRNPLWSHLHLQHLYPNSKPAQLAVDAVTAHLQLTAALTQFLGLHGSAIPIDILNISGADVWIRIPHEDHSALNAALGGWISSKGEGWRVMDSSSWDARALGRESGQDLFHD